MRVARYKHNGRTNYGVIEPDGEHLRAITGDPFDRHELATDIVALSDVEVLVPVEPSKIVGFGRNFAPADRADGEEPSFFFKPTTSLAADGEPIRIPPEVQGGALYEVELAVVIGKRCRDVAAGDYADVVFGYTIANDITGLDLAGLPAGHYPVKAKAYDTFCPLGPWIETEIDPLDARLGCSVDGVARQEATTADLLTGVPELVRIASHVMTLLPGDVILTGTPPGLAPLTGGEEVDAWIEGIGHLRNVVAAA
jgi:2-keto-4-pentenoate hydratase/2-oxohepta-3-ene-1,7-dioic acid hydratase in catechol pathway